MKGIWEYLHGKAQMPKPLELAIRCQQWNTLPVQGGYLDQPKRRMTRMELALDYYKPLSSWMRAKSAKHGDGWVTWQKENNAACELVAYVSKLTKE